MNKISEYVMVKEAARLLGVSDNTLRNWGDKFTYYRNPMNGYRLYKRSEIMAFLDNIAQRVKDDQSK